MEEQGETQELILETDDISTTSSAHLPLQTDENKSYRIDEGGLRVTGFALL